MTLRAVLFVLLAPAPEPLEPVPELPDDPPAPSADVVVPPVEVMEPPRRSAAEIAAGAIDRAEPVVSAARRLSLDECVRIAMEGSLRIQQADARVDEAVATRKVVRGQFGPTLFLDANVQVWAEEVVVSFPAPMIPGLPMEEPEALVVQDQVTATIRTTLSQPLTGIWGISERYRVQKKAESLANLEVRREQEAVALDIATAYYEALKAERLAEVARLSRDAIAANRAQVEAFYDAGVMARDQLLEADTRLAEAESFFLRLRGQTRIARSNLAFVMGMPVDADIAPQPLPRADLPRIERDLDLVAGRAMGRRIEVAEATLRLEQAKHARRAAASNLVPQLSALASYQRTEGQAFALANQFFVGLNLTWNVWEWGVKYYRLPEARARERQAQIAAMQVNEGIRLEIHRALIELEVSEQQLEATDAAVAHAIENQRIVQLRFDAAAASTTEVLDAVTRRARAEAEQANAYYAHLQAIAAYRHGLGELLESQGMERTR